MLSSDGVTIADSANSGEIFSVLMSNGISGSSFSLGGHTHNFGDEISKGNNSSCGSLGGIACKAKKFLSN